MHRKISKAVQAKVSSLAAAVSILAVACGGDGPKDMKDTGGAASGNAAAAGVGELVGGSGGTANVQAAAGGGTAQSGGAGGFAGSAGQSGASGGGAPSLVRFTFTPGWKGVTHVSVIGGFGKADDWQSPLLVLTDDGTGTFSGSTELPPGRYLYKLKVGGGASSLIDPLVATIEHCPPESNPAVPTVPCSVLRVPQPAADPVHHIRGQLVADGAGVEGWDVSIERNDQGFHHSFIARTSSGADGRFDLPIAAGRYHLTASRPFNSSQNRVDIPLALSVDASSFDVAADVNLAPAEVSFHDNALLAPIDPTPRVLPVTLHFPMTQGAVAMQATAYGPRGTDAPFWWYSPLKAETSAIFTGDFNGAHAGTPKAISGEQYWWGVIAKGAPDAAGVEWSRQSMLFPLNVK